MIVLLLKLTLLLILALAIQPLLRRSSAAMRHLVYTCALAGALLLPLTLLAPPEVGAFRINGTSVLAASLWCGLLDRACSFCASRSGT
jgi:hypothetical protein